MVFFDGVELIIVFACHLELARFLKSFNILIAAKIYSILDSSDLLFREKHLSPIFEIFHEALSLEVGIETHGWTDLLRLLPRPHHPVCPLWLRRYTINIAILCNGSDASLFVCKCIGKLHPWRPDHFASMTLLLKALAIIVSFIHRF